MNRYYAREEIPQGIALGPAWSGNKASRLGNRVGVKAQDYHCGSKQLQYTEK